MKRSMLSLVSLVVCLAGSLHAAEPPAMPQPTLEHEWLKQFVGEWDTQTEIFMEPGKPPMTATGTETTRMIGGFWVVGESKGEMMGQPFTGIMSVGYDPEKKKYIGTWIDSNTSMLWNYTGSVDASGKILTLDTEGFCPMEGQVCQMKDVVEFKSKDERVLTSSRLGKDGKWTQMMTMTAKRKK